jgi:hypothetical protein
VPSNQGEFYLVNRQAIDLRGVYLTHKDALFSSQAAPEVGLPAVKAADGLYNHFSLVSCRVNLRRSC